MANVLETIERLRSLARRAGTQAEAEAAAGAAERLIAKYQLDEVELTRSIADNGTAREEPIVPEQPLWQGKSTKVWLTMLANGLCTDHGCALIVSRRNWPVKSTVLKFAGTKADTDLVRYLFVWLSTEIDRLARREHGTAAINAFRVGAVVGVLTAMRSARKQEVVETSRQSSQMVLVERAELSMITLKDAIGAAGKRLKKGSGPSLHDSSAYARGHRAGSDMTSRHGLGAGSAMLALPPRR